MKCTGAHENDFIAYGYLRAVPVRVLAVVPRRGPRCHCAAPALHFTAHLYEGRMRSGRHDLRSSPRLAVPFFVLRQVLLPVQLHHEPNTLAPRREGLGRGDTGVGVISMRPCIVRY